MKKKHITKALDGVWQTGGEALTAIMKERGLNQKQLAARVSGIGQSEISRFCSGTRDMNERHRKALAKALACDPEDLEDGALKLSPNDLLLKKIVRELPEKLKPQAIFLLGALLKK